MFMSQFPEERWKERLEDNLPYYNPADTPKNNKTYGFHFKLMSEIEDREHKLRNQVKMQ